MLDILEIKIFFILVTGTVYLFFKKNMLILHFMNTFSHASKCETYALLLFI